MATMTFDLTDSNGVPTEIGDTIRVVYPEIDRGTYVDDLIFYLPAVTALARVRCSPSRGLYLKVLSVESVEYEDESLEAEFPIGIVPGKLTAFRRTVWKWWRVDKAVDDED